MWLSCCTHSSVLQELETGNAHNDHFAVGVQLCWNSETAAVPKQKSRSSFCRSAIGPNRSRINCVGLQAAPWSTDIETQVQGLNKQLLHQVGLACPVSPAVPKKRCLNGEVWTARDRARNRLRFLFHLWKHPSTDRYAAYECTTLCSMLRLNSQYLHHARKLRSMLRQSKIQALSTLRLMLFLTQHLQGKFCIASNLFWIKIKRACLPFVKDSTGNICTTPEAAQQRWIELFQQMEGGRRLPQEEYRAEWHANLSKFLQVEIWNRDCTNPGSTKPC